MSGSGIRSSTRASVDLVQWIQDVHVHETRWCTPLYETWIMYTSMEQDMFVRTSTRNTSESPNKYPILEDTPGPVRIHFCVRHRSWRSWSSVKLHCLYDRLRLGVVPTYYPVNSWSSRSSSCEEFLFPYLHTHIVEEFKLFPPNWHCWNTLLEMIKSVYYHTKFYGLF